METARPPFLRCVLVVASLVAALLPASATAQGRARMSPGLAARLQAGDWQESRVIVTGTPEEVDRFAARHRLRIRTRLQTGAVVDVPAGSLAALEADGGVAYLSEDQVVRSHMAVTNATIGADLLHAGGVDGVGVLTGAGVGVAVLDSGMAHVAELRGKVVASVDFTDDRGRGIDAFGHGTHVAAIIAGADAPGPGDAAGVAPATHLVNVKVLGADGSGRVSDVIRGIDWVIANAARLRVRVINLSLGAPVTQSWRDDPLCQAVERAYRAGLVVVASAGNYGKTADGQTVYGGITTPGNSPHAITVGASNAKGTPWREDDAVASYSSRGPTPFDMLIKPDLVAPGNRVRGPLAPNATLAREHPELVVDTGVERRLELSGTSMAAAAVSGAVALLLEHQPARTFLELRTAIQASAVPMEGIDLATQGSGNLDAAEAAALADLSKNRSRTAAESPAAFGAARRGGLLARPIVRGDSAVTADASRRGTIVWGDSAVTADASRRGTIVWGDSAVTADTAWRGTIVWGDSFVAGD